MTLHRTTEDNTLGTLVAHASNLPEVTSRGCIPLEPAGLQTAAQRAIAAARMRRNSESEDMEALTWVASVLVDALAGEADAPRARLAMWCTLRDMRRAMGTREYRTLVIAWNALQHGRERLQVRVTRKGWNAQQLLAVLGLPTADLDNRYAVRPLQDYPLSRLADLAGWRAAEPAARWAG